MALNTIKFLDRLKRFGLAQNILGPVEGQGNRAPQEYRASKKNLLYWPKGAFEGYGMIQN